MRSSYHRCHVVLSVTDAYSEDCTFNRWLCTAMAIEWNVSHLSSALRLLNYRTYVCTKVRSQLDSARLRVTELKSSLAAPGQGQGQGQREDSLGNSAASVESTVLVTSAQDEGQEKDKDRDQNKDHIPDAIEGVLAELKGIFAVKATQHMNTYNELHMRINDLESKLHVKTFEVTAVRNSLESQLSEFKGALTELSAVSLESSDP